MVYKKILQRIKASIAKKKANPQKMKNIYKRINGGQTDQDIFDKWQLTINSPFHKPNRCQLCTRRLTNYFLVRRKDDKQNIIALGPWCLYILTKFSELSNEEISRKFDKMQSYKISAARIVRNNQKQNKLNINKGERIQEKKSISNQYKIKQQIINSLFKYIDKSPRLKNIWQQIKDNQYIYFSNFVDAKVVAQICGYRNISLLPNFLRLSQEFINQNSFQNLEFEESKLYINKIQIYENTKNVRKLFKRRKQKNNSININIIEPQKQQKSNNFPIQSLQNISYRSQTQQNVQNIKKDLPNNYLNDFFNNIRKKLIESVQSKGNEFLYKN